MCGIVGLFDTRGDREVDAALLARMNRTLRHRGPDQEGIHCEPGTGLGHRRLAIIDLAGGRQPLANEDGSVWVVYNGEIYNFVELVGELEALGHRFASRCDTEVIVHAWEAWGEGCVERFRGMFAFAVWDRQRQSLFLARDRLGIKPLYYTLLDDGWLLFASELKGLMVAPGFCRELDPLAVEEYFAYGYVPDPRTIFRQSEKLPGGHHLTLVRGGELRPPQQYWDLRFRPGREHTDEATAAVSLRERLRESVKAHLVSDVPLGAFLSGGVDSSGVVALMAGSGGGPVTACTVTFAEAAFDEGKYAREVAGRYGVIHHEERAEGASLFGEIGRMAELFDEPFADSSALPTWQVCGLARKSVTVALSGDGGDEGLAGYDRYGLFLAEERIRSWLPLGIRRPLFGVLGRLYPKLDWAPRRLRGKSTFEALARDTVAGYHHGVSVMREDWRERLFTTAFKRELQGYHAVEVMRRHAAHAEVDHPLSLAQYLDFKTFLGGRVLTKVDRASMAHGLEVRVPVLDHELVEWMATLPVHYRWRDGGGKYLLKKALEPLLSRELLYRPKMGFSLPLSAWLRGPLAERLWISVCEGPMRESGWFDLGWMRWMMDRHRQGRRDFGAALWTLILFDAFLRSVQR
ncbi:MAG: amidotransferase 1, exosortase A system-associated [Magnetococcales bacterium]|nr:amidotransferase 1, exosortase A system-associated [Magnetococcales bacterium]